MSTNEKDLKPHSTPLTLQWLEENYELGEGVCIPRSALYVHYIDFCSKYLFEPVNAASFGKIIRQQFPQITTRRLGTRGQSKYHYYGIAVKDTSAYFESSYAKKIVKPGTENTHETKHSWVFSPRSKIGTRLPDLPHIEDLVVPSDIERNKLVTFIMMYQTHCQRILDIVIRANFDEIKTYLIHFWNGLPVHIHGLLVSRYIAHLVGHCDLLLYRTICSVVVPSSQQTASDSFIQNLKKFANNINGWLVDALHNTPEEIRKAKFKYAARFSNHILRQISQSSLIGAARNVLQSSEAISHILDDLDPLDLDLICRQTASLAIGDQNETFEIMMRVFQDLENILEEQLTLEEFCQWLDETIDKETINIQQRTGCKRATAARQQLLLWSFFNSRVMQELLLLGAESYGSCQLLGLFLEQYALNYVDEEMFRVDTEETLQRLTGQLTETAESAANDLEADFTFDMSSAIGLNYHGTRHHLLPHVQCQPNRQSTGVYQSIYYKSPEMDCINRRSDTIRNPSQCQHHPLSQQPLPLPHPPQMVAAIVPPPPQLVPATMTPHSTAHQLYSVPTHSYSYWDASMPMNTYYTAVPSSSISHWSGYGPEMARPPDLQHA